MAAWKQYVLDASRVIWQGSWQVSSIFTTGLSFLQSRKRKSSDTDTSSDSETKKSYSESSTDWSEGETLQRAQRRELKAEGSSHVISTVFKTKTNDFQILKRKSSNGVVWGEPEPKKLHSQNEDSFCGNSCLARSWSHMRSGCEETTGTPNMDCAPLVAHSLVGEPRFCKTSKRKSTDEGFKTDPKKSRPEESVKTDSESESAGERKQKERRRLRKALRRVARARVSDLKMRYEEHEELREGGFGSVFAGIRISDQQPVAIKHIKREDVEFAPVLIEKEVFTVPSEVVLMTRAAPDRHSIGLNPSVSLLDWYLQDQGQEVVLVMERPTPSEDLYHYCQKNAPLPEVHAKELIRQVVNTLVDLHSKGVFHRDIKMENLLVQTTDSGPRIRVIDFGCGCNPQSEPYYKFKGTANFAPPEFFRSKCYRAGPTSVWQTGARLYELLRKNSDKAFTTKDFVKGFPFIPFLIMSGVSKDCSDFLQACLTLDPDQRINLDQLSYHPWLRPPL